MDHDYFQSNLKQGFCELCGKQDKRIERHHIRYRPERTINICHPCHFKCHHQSFQLTEREIEIMLSRVYRPEVMQKNIGKLRSLLSLYLQQQKAGSQFEELSPQVAPNRDKYV